MSRQCGQRGAAMHHRTVETVADRVVRPLDEFASACIGQFIAAKFNSLLGHSFTRCAPAPYRQGLVTQ